MTSDDPARGLRRLLFVLFVLALAAAGGAFALSQRGGETSTRSKASLFPSRFSEADFVSGEVALVTSYDADGDMRRVTGTIDVHGTTYVVARCSAGIVTVNVSGLMSTRPCTGKPVGVVALQLTRAAQLTATVTASQSTRWGFAVYR